MTRLAILADIHGNLPALEAVMRDMEAFAPDHVIVAGDVINPAPFSVEVLEIILSRRWAVLRGNHEFYFLGYKSMRQPENQKNWTTLGVLYEKVSPYYNLIAAWPDSLTLDYPDAPPIRVVHGIPGNPYDAIDRLTSEAGIISKLAGVTETTFISGHYHLSYDRWAGGYHVLNPGSVGMPCEGRHEANYMILDGDKDGWQATFRRVPADFSPVFRGWEAENYFERAGVMGYLLAQQIRLARPVVYPFTYWMREHYPEEANSIARVDEFLATGLLWDYLPPHYQFCPENGVAIATPAPAKP